MNDVLCPLGIVIEVSISVMVWLCAFEHVSVIVVAHARVESPKLVPSELRVGQ